MTAQGKPGHHPHPRPVAVNPVNAPPARAGGKLELGDWITNNDC